MNFQVRSDLVKTNHRLPFECVALLLQGGGALGAYQGGVYEALAEADIHPNWIAGISIGAINAAIIAGNPPNSRVDRLREFWMQVTSSAPWDWSRNPFVDLARGDNARNLLNQTSASLAAAFGAAGFFSARPVMPWLQPGGSLAATSFYDTKHLKQTLERLVDFDRLNAGMTRFSAGAVNVRTGNFVYFDTTTHTIAPEHVMASGALPPGFPAIEIDGEHYWDGGLVSNTPLQWVIESNPRRQDTLAFQVDLWSSQGALPRNLAEVATRHKEIQFSSRTRASTGQFKNVHRVQRALDALLRRLPVDLEANDDLKILKSVASDKVYNIIHLIYRAKNHEGHSKDYEFSRLSMQDHWRAGYHDAVHTLRHREVLARPTSLDGVFTFDLERDGRE
ncbi:MAG: patatin-like phospholipase family protein [Pseudolabrys sp.]